jgi:hypothetical protein
VSGARSWRRGAAPALLAFAVFAAAVAALAREALARNDGNFVYALDDPYIHMAISRTFAANGTWGIRPGAFASASSSPLWTVLLAAVFALVGPDERAPFVLNLVFALPLLGLAAFLAAERARPAWLTACVLGVAVLAAPLPTLALEGLEHILQAGLCLAFAAAGVRALCCRTQPGRAPGARSRLALFALAPLVTAVRYEGAFLVAIVGVLFFAKRRWRDGLVVGLLGLLPIVAFGLYAVAQGGLVLPNPVLLKARSLGGLPTSSGLGAIVKSTLRAGVAIVKTPHLLVLVGASLALLLAELRRERDPWRAPVLWNVFFVSLALLHLQFAGIGWFYRYEAYLVVMGLVVLLVSGDALGALLRPPRGADATPLARGRTAAAGALLVLVVGFPLVDRSWSAWVSTPRGTTNIYEQQVQMGRFVREAYPGVTVAANDIGAIAWLAPESGLLDLAGLASIDVARDRIAGRFDRERMGALAREHDVRALVIYESWFERFGIPAEWTRVGRWTIADRVAASDDTVSFYAVRAEDVGPLTERLRAFAPRLPRGVRQSGAYVDGPGGGDAPEARPGRASGEALLP